MYFFFFLLCNWALRFSMLGSLVNSRKLSVISQLMLHQESKEHGFDSELFFSAFSQLALL